MIDWKPAETIVEQLDLETIPACPMCLFELAWAMHKGRSANQIAATLTTVGTSITGLFGKISTKLNAITVP